MKKLLTAIFFLVALAGSAQPIENKPNPPRLVNDFVGVLTADQKETLEYKLIAYNDSTSTQIAIIIIPTTGDYDIQEVALKYLREWGIGTAEKNNGIVLLAAINDRKIRIEAGYGMEGVIPDITAKHIINNEIVPNFKSGNYYRGFDEATTAIIKAAAGEYKATATNKRGGKGIGWIGILLIIVMVLLFSGGSGGGLGPLILGSMLGNAMRGSGGSGWSSGGGFGGFGGGSGGGGGASGSW